VHITNDLIWIFLFVAVLVLISFLKDKKHKIKRIVFFGDSLTAYGTQPHGYISVIKDLLYQENIDHYDLINSGTAGDEVHDLLMRLQKDVIVKLPDIVVLWIGVNDVWHTNNLFSLSDTTEFEKDYTEIVSQILSHKIKLMLVTPAVIGEKKDDSNPLDIDLNKHCDVIRHIAEKFKLPLCDMHALFHLFEEKHNKQNMSKGILTIDGVHLNDTGNRFAAGEILKVLKEV
jgi:lysophospholipase L1-like esterase